MRNPIECDNFIIIDCLSAIYWKQYKVRSFWVNRDQNNVAKGGITPRLYSPGGSMGLMIWRQAVICNCMFWHVLLVVVNDKLSTCLCKER